MRDDDERAVVRLQRRLELLDRLQVEVVRRLVEDEAVDPARSQLRELRPRPLARRERRCTAGARAPAPRLNFASSVRASSGGRPARGGERVDQRLLPVVRLRGAGRACRRPSSGRACVSPPTSGSSPSSSASSVVLPLPFRPVTATRSPGARSRSIGPSLNVAALADGACERGDAVARPLGGGERELEPPRLVRLLDVLDPLQRTLGLAHLPRQRLRPAPVRPARRVREEHAARARLVAAGVQERLHLAAPFLCVGEGRVLPLPRELARGRELAPAAGVLLDAAGPRVDLRDPRRPPGRGRHGRARRPRDRPRSASRKRSSRSSPSKSRSLVGSSSRSTSKRESRIAASPARAASPPESVAVSCSSETESPSSAHVARARASRSAPPSARNRSSAARVARRGSSRRRGARPPPRRRRRRCAGRGRRAASLRDGGRAPAAGSRR